MATASQVGVWKEPWPGAAAFQDCHLTHGEVTMGTEQNQVPQSSAFSARITWFSHMNVPYIAVSIVYFWILKWLILIIL